MAPASEPPADVLCAYSALRDLAGAAPAMRGEPDGGIRLEVNVTERATAHWDELLAVLDLGRNYGLSDSNNGQSAWVSFAPPAGTP